MSTQTLAAMPSGYLLHGSYPVVDPSPHHLVSKPTTMAFDANSFMEKFKASLQPIFDEFKMRMLEIVVKKEKRTAEYSVAQALADAHEEAARKEEAAATQMQITATAIVGSGKRITAEQPGAVAQQVVAMRSQA